MAQLLFDALTGGISAIDSQTVLAVQSFLDASETITTDTVPTLDEEDVFQCGKCKKQFTSLNTFMNHKKEQCQPPSTKDTSLETCLAPSNTLVSTSGTTQGTNYLVVKTAGPGSGANYTLAPSTNRQGSPLGSLYLSEADLLSLTLDSVTSVPTLQALTANSAALQQSTNNAKGGTESITIQSLPNQTAAGALGLSLLSNGILSSSGLLLTSQGTANGGTNLYLTISNPPAIEKEEMVLSAEVPKVKAPNVKEGESTKNSVVNVITEFTNNVVKPKKKASAKSSLSSTLVNGSECGSAEGVGTSKKGLSKVLQNMKMKCTFCDKTFNKNFDLQQHIRSHTGEKPFQCIICGRAFAQKSNVKKHIQTHKVWPDGLASTLPCTLTNNEEIDQPDSPEPQVTENVAKAPSPDDGAPKVDNSYVCPYCKFSGKSYFELKSHMKQHKSKKVYRCILSTCAQLYEDLDSFLDHVKTHETEMTYRCHLCSKVFQSLYDLGVHQYSHSLYPNQPNCKPTKPKKVYRCSSCLNKYSSSTALDHHMATCNHNYACPHCNKAFPCERYLRRHLLVHSTRSIFICSVCKKSFKAEHYLRIHLLIHTGEKPYTCPHCNTAFNRKDKLKRHLLIHEPLKRFKCPFRNHSGCLKEFNRPDKLKAHVLTHGQNKPFFCRTCGRNFTRRAQLKTHQQQHEEEKDFPFHCVRCGSGFLNQDIYDSHVCVQYATKRWFSESRCQRSSRSRRIKFSLLRPRKKPKKTVAEADCIPEETLPEDGGIRTAHIEIISATGDIGPVGDLSQISLQLHPSMETSTREVSQDIQNITSIKDFSVFEYGLTQIDKDKIPECNSLMEPEVTVSELVE